MIAAAIPLSELIDINPPTPRGLLASDEEVAIVPMASVSEQGFMRVLEYKSANEVSSGLSYFTDGDVLVAKITPCYENNKITRASVDRKHAFGSTEFHVLRPKGDEIDARYLTHFLRQDAIREQGVRRMTGSGGQRRIPKSFLEALEIPLPHVDEQRRLAAILDQAEALRSKRRQAVAKMEELQRVIFADIFGDPRTNSRRLPLERLGNLIKVSSGKGLVGSDQRGGIYPVYGGNGVNGWHDEFTAPAGTIVIGRVGAYCGVVHVTDRSSWITDNALVVKQLSTSVRPSYLAAALRYANLNQYAGKSAQPLVSGSRIYPVEIGFPSDEDQERYEVATQNLNAIQSRANTHLTSLNSLFVALQYRVFREGF
jgi:type I restriction enzyme S subunit